MYAVRRNQSNLQPHEQGQAVKLFQTYKEASDWLNAKSDRENYYISTGN